VTAVARYTLLEMSRRRLLVALVTVAVALIVVLGIAPLIVPGFRTGIQRSYFLLSTFNGVVGFFLLISGFAIGMTVIYNDLDSGAAVGIFVKPISRLQYTVGKSAATLIVLALLTAVLTLLTVALLLINGGTGYDYGAVVTNLLAGTANILVLVVLLMALASVMNNVVAAIIGFVVYEVFGAVSTLHALVSNHTLTASPWAQIINVLYWLVPHSLISSLPHEVVRIGLASGLVPTTTREGRAINPYASVPAPSGIGDILFWATYCLVLGALLYLAVRRRQV
jgi:ABC-type transport system involved in multi-copper enzyme maturation permease subunit